MKQKSTFTLARWGMTLIGATVRRTAIAMLTVLFTLMTQTTWAKDWDGDGSSVNPYSITTAADLNLLSEKVNAGNNYSGKYFVLEANIAYNSSVENNFTPIGFNGTNFSGNFDGKGYCVSGININKSVAYIGLFGDASGATITNLVVSGFRLNGSNYVGGIVGKMTSGTLSNCLVLSTRVSCSNTCGLIAGSFSGTLSNNFYDTLSWLNSSSGIDCGVDSSNNTNASFGVRIMGADGVSVELAETATSTYASSGFKVYSSGLMYQNICYKKMLSSVTLHITYNGVVEQGYVLEGFKAYGSMMSEASGSGNYSVSLSGMADCVIEPHIAIQYWTGTGTEADPYLITSIAGMNHLAEEVNNGNSYEYKHFALDADLKYDRTVENNFTPIGYNPKFFKGNLDGRGHTISGINVLRAAGVSQEVGIIGFAKGELKNRRYIKNLTVVNSSFVSTNRDDVAAICGYSEYADIENCHVGEDVYVSGRTSVGGIAGKLDGKALGCTSGATIVAQDGDNDAGGICGDCYSTIRDCIYYGKSVSAGYKGAIAGYKYSGTVANNYYTTYGIGGINKKDTDGARFAIITKSAPSNLGATTKTYGTGSYIGITVYENALYYKGQYYWYDENLVKLINKETTNEGIITDKDHEMRNVVLDGRTLYKDGSWNTICLPFDLKLSGSPLDGATAHTLTEASISGTTLHLTFGNAVNTLQAGTPYIIKWNGDGTSNIENPVFYDVTIDKTTHDCDFGSGDTRVRFLGTYEALTFSTEPEKSILLLGSENTLYYAGAGHLGACHAYLKIGDNSQAARELTSFDIDFGEGETTGIGTITNNQYPITDGAWYNLDGRKLQGKPTTKGLYIHNGLKVVIK